MLYLIGQIVCCLLLAALLGFIIGWLLKGLLMRRKIALIEEECNKKLERQHEDLSEPYESDSAKPVTSSNPDDLILISGIGPVLERKLHSLGITTFRQIAEWTKADIEAVSKQIGPFRDRIIKEDWVKQAKRLHKQKYGESI